MRDARIRLTGLDGATRYNLLVGSAQPAPLVLAMLVACSSPAPPAPEAAPPASPSVTPALTSQMLDTSVGHTRLVARVLSPEAGVERARQALDDARTEVARIAALDGGPELRAADAAAVRQAFALGVRASIPADELLVAYAIDRAADRLIAAGMADFYVDGGDIVRAQGSQDASIRRGWHAAVLGADGDAIGTARLNGQAMAQRAGASPACTAIAASAVLAVGARKGLEIGGQTPEGLRDLGLRVGLAGGEERQNPAFQALLTPIGAGY